MKNLILGYTRGRNKWHGFSEALKTAGQQVDLAIDTFDNITGPYDRVWSMAESMLPLQAELEEKWGIQNISKDTAAILTNKKKLDDFVVDLMPTIIPDSVIPTCLTDLDIFGDKAFCIKPVIGAGGKQNYDTSVAYMSYHNKESFMKSVPCDLLFQVNQKGFDDALFNNYTNYYMAQEHLHADTLYTPYHYINEKGNIKTLFWLVANNGVNYIDEHRFETKPQTFMTYPELEVPSKVEYYSQYYFETIIDELKIKNMFFSGPDFYWDGVNIKIIDCNPRIGSGLQIMNELHNGQYLPAVLLNKQFDIECAYMWSPAQLKPGVIKELKNTSHIEKYFGQNHKLKAGQILTGYSWCVADIKNYANPVLTITAKNKSDMLDTYQTVCQQLQDCIIYA